MNDTKLLPDDPRLTAYALGELSGDERAAVEAALRENPALRSVVADVRMTARYLEAALAAEPMLEADAAKLRAKAAQQLGIRRIHMNDRLARSQLPSANCSQNRGGRLR